MWEVGAQDAFSLESHLHSHSLGGKVVGVSDQLEPSEAKVIEGVSAKHAKCAGGDPSTPCVAGAPVADVPITRSIHSHTHRADDEPLLFHSEAVRTEAKLVRHEGARVVLGIGTGNDRDPALYLGILARGVDSRNISLSPRPQHERLIGKLHRSSLCWLMQRAQFAGAIPEQHWRTRMHSPDLANPQLTLE